MTGPVSVIATRRERALYSKLAPSKRARFVELFWRRRDPDLSTRRNEYLEEFSTRWAAAERYFGSSGGPGWRTAFGTVLLVFGIPDQVEFVPPPRPVPSRSADRDELLEQNSVSDGVAVRFYYRGSETVPGSARRTRGPNGPFERLDPHIVFTYWHGSWRAGCRPADPQPEPVDLGTVPVTGPDDGGTYSRGRGWQQVAGCPELSELLRELMETEVRASLRNPPGYEVLASRP